MYVYMYIAHTYISHIHLHTLVYIHTTHMAHYSWWQSERVEERVEERVDEGDWRRGKGDRCPRTVPKEIEASENALYFGQTSRHIMCVCVCMCVRVYVCACVCVYMHLYAIYIYTYNSVICVYMQLFCTILETSESMIRM
jgi:hypothetical protein